jgi:hypothetical protein
MTLAVVLVSIALEHLIFDCAKEIDMGELMNAAPRIIQRRLEETARNQLAWDITCSHLQRNFRYPPEYKYYLGEFVPTITQAESTARRVKVISSPGSDRFVGLSQAGFGGTRPGVAVIGLCSTVRFDVLRVSTRLVGGGIPVGGLDDHVIWGQVVRFHISDELYLERGRIDAAASTLARWPSWAGWQPSTGWWRTLSPPHWTTSCSPAGRSSGRPGWSDGRTDDYSPVDTAGWWFSGSTAA